MIYRFLMNRIRILSSMVGCALLLTACTETVTISSLLKEMADRDQLTRYPDPSYRLIQFSSYNRQSVSPDAPGWFANADMSHFIRTETNDGRREFVMLECDGPGAIVRWWMTFYKAQHGQIRVYLDHNDIPIIQGAPAALLSGKLLTASPLAMSVQDGAPLGEEGRDYDHNLYFPIPFSTHCKITYECDSLRLLYDYEGTAVPDGYYWPDVFYNIACRIYPPETRVESFSETRLGNASRDLEATVNKLLNQSVEPLSDDADLQVINPGDSLIIDLSKSGKAVSRLAVRLEAADYQQALRSTVMKVTFDGQPGIWAPVGEFFGTGYAGKPFETWMNRDSGNGFLESFWVMPFRKNCVVTFINYGSQAVSVRMSADLTPYRWTGESMYFHTVWHEYNGIGSRAAGMQPFDLNFAEVKGKGLYVGDQVSLYNSTYKWWGEGDEKIFVDGETFPSSFGTGSEDYYGYSFARREPFSHPFLAQPEGTGNMDAGITVNARHRSLDAIPFEKSIRSDIELWHWDSVTMNYSLTTRYYAKRPAETNIQPDPAVVKLPVLVNYYTERDFERIEKTDAHLHYVTTDLRFINFARSIQMKIVSPNVDSGHPIEEQWEISKAVLSQNDRDISFLGTFSVEDYGQPDFAVNTISRMDKMIGEGASGIKIWKNIGMEMKSGDGIYVMADDPAFDPIYRHLADNKIPLLAHLGEPRDCWLPVEEMTDWGDRIYYQNHPEYYMFLHPEMPSYEDQITARDRVLERFPSLIFVGAHLGSLEWNVDELAARFQKFPNLSVDLAARMGHLRNQSSVDREKVRNFMIQYQHRILYGTDMEIYDAVLTDFAQATVNARRAWMNDWLYLATDSVVNGVQGLKLPAGVIDRIYSLNARRVYGL